MKKTLSALLILSSLSAHAAPGNRFLSINSRILEKIKNHLPVSPTTLEQKNDIAIIEIEPQDVEHVSAMVHKRLNRCGGFTAHESLEDAQKSFVIPSYAQIDPLAEYVINQKHIVPAMVDDIREENIREVIQTLSSYDTRHYQSKTGTDAVQYIKKHWQKLTKHRSDVSVELFKHKSSPQPSIILTIKGSEKPDEIVVLGGHVDSISDEHFAPGADDNASGVASITEVIRVLMDHNYQPKRTIKFMGYAAEEIGLVGSYQIARTFSAEKRKVVGVMQLDMTLYKGSEDKDIILISDYTNKDQNKFLGKLIDEYVKVPWGYSVCGYGCSDHASWHAQGYPASFAFESRFEESSPLIHTTADQLENYGGEASHSVKFSKLATAFVVEMSN